MDFHAFLPFAVALPVLAGHALALRRADRHVVPGHLASTLLVVVGSTGTLLGLAVINGFEGMAYASEWGQAQITAWLTAYTWGATAAAAAAMLLALGMHGAAVARSRRAGLRVLHACGAAPWFVALPLLFTVGVWGAATGEACPEAMSGGHTDTQAVYLASECSTGVFSLTFWSLLSMTVGAALTLVIAVGGWWMGVHVKRAESEAAISPFHING